MQIVRPCSQTSKMRAKWKWWRVVCTALFFFFLYKFVKFLEILCINYSAGSPLDFAELFSEKDPKKLVEEWLKFKNDYIPYDFHRIAIENEHLIASQRKEFLRQSAAHNYESKMMIGK
ncbi:unnamed protein product [Caenorhabditis sp. 36 PRJEB53466]|nr:unnamed protein product [Caenorhabditis sp. 36 PRJEB53466]